MDIKVLGPLEARENGSSIMPSAGKPRQVLALLAMQPGQVVTVPTLMEELWGTRLPRSALTTLQTYVMQLRRGIQAALRGCEHGPEDAKDVLVTRYGGYVLDVQPDDVDVHRYERLATNGVRAMEAGDYQWAARVLRSALEIWRGEVLVDVQAGTSLGIEVTRLQESRLSVLEARIEADLQLGRHTMLVGELSTLTARHPSHENLCGQYMLALYRAGRQWRALDAFRKLRGLLIDEFGVEPSARLQHLQRAILNSDPELDEPASHHGHLAGIPAVA